MRRCALAPILAVGLIAGGCAAERATAPSALLPADAPFKTLRYQRAGMAVSVPSRSLVVERGSPEVFRATVADWYVAGFAYRRKEQLPRSGGELETARRRLVAEARRRDPRFRPVAARTTRTSGSPAVEVVGDQVIDRRRLRTRSIHVYKGTREYVLELAAPVAEYPAIDRDVFGRVARSLRVTGRGR